MGLKQDKQLLKTARSEYKGALREHAEASSRLAAVPWTPMPDGANAYFADSLAASQYEVPQLLGVRSAQGTPHFGLTLDIDDLIAVVTTDEKSKKTAVDLKRDAVEAKKKDVRDKWGRQVSRWTSLLLVVLAAAAIGFGAWNARDSDLSDTKVHQWTSLAIVGGALPLLLLALGLAWFKPSGGGVVGFIIGTDNRLSTSMLQILLWTTVVVFAFGMFVSQIAFGIELKNKDGFKGFDETYLFLLGGPFAAAVLAKYTATVKSEEQTTQQAPADTPATKDLATDDSGGTSLTDLQFLLFNFVALAYFAVGFAQDPSTLPAIEPTLVGLTSISALTYVGGKVVNSNPPMITSVSIVSGGDAGKLVPGQTVLRVVGKNFLPSGTDEDKDLNVTVVVGGTEMPELILKSNTELQGQVPAGVASGQTTISVRTAEGSTSEEWTKLEVA